MIEIVEYMAKGRFNSKEHGFYIIEHDAPSAEEVEIIEQIPFMQGQYDFSMLTGERILVIALSLLLFGDLIRHTKNERH